MRFIHKFESLAKNYIEGTEDFYKKTIIVYRLAYSTLRINFRAVDWAEANEMLSFETFGRS